MQKKWKFWRNFKKFFLTKKRKKFFYKLEWHFNNKRILWEQYFFYNYLKLKHLKIIKGKYSANAKFFLLLKHFELRLCTTLMRARFCYKLINSNHAIKSNYILINGYIIRNLFYVLNLLDLFQKRRKIKSKHKQWSEKKRKHFRRVSRFTWRRNRWRYSRFVIWRVRRASQFNMYWSRKTNVIKNYLVVSLLFY
jgi:hypothetical protein